MSSRKIWSIPISLALVLALAAMVGLYGVVQAQALPSVPSSVTVVVPDDATSDIVIYEVSNYDPQTSGSGHGAATFTVGDVSQSDVGGQAVDPATGSFTVSLQAADQNAVVSPDDKDRIELSASQLTAGHTYTFKVTATYDRDIETDASGEGNDVSDADILVDNDTDGKLETTITVHAVAVQEALTFQVESSKVVAGEIISRVGRDRGSNPLSFDIGNMGPGTASVSQLDTVTDVKFEMSGSSKVVVRAGANALGATGPHTGTIKIAHGDFDLDGDDENDFFNVEVEASTVAVVALSFTATRGEVANEAGTVGDPDEDGIHYQVIIPETTASGTGVLPYTVSGDAVAVDNTGEDNDLLAEAITGVIGGTNASLFRVNNSTMAIEYAGATGGLTAGDEYVLRLTASGDTGLANRLIVGMAKIIVADVDSPPVAPSALSVILNENDPDEGGLVKDDKEVMDFAGVGSDPEGRTLTYDTEATGFDFDGTKLMTMGPIPDTIVVRSNDNPNTDAVETDANWPTGGNSGWSLATTPATSLYPDMVRKINVSVSDGVPSNDQTIELTITLDLNEPPVVTAAVVVDAEDGSMSYSGTATVGDDDRGVDILPFADIMTDADVDSLKVELLPIPLPDDAEEDAEPDPIPTELLVRENAVQLIFVPGGVDSLTYDFVLTANDENNPADEVDLTITVNVVVTVEQPPAPESDIVEIVVEENTDVCNVKMDDGTLGDCTLAGQVDGATTYTILSGVDDGDTDYSIDSSTGVISVDNMPDYEADKNPAFIVEITNDDGDRLGVIAVRVTVEDDNEAPTVADIGGVAWVYETAQVGDPVQTAPIPETGSPAPDANDHKTVLMVDDPEKGTITFSIKEPKQSFTISSGVVAVDHDNDPTTADVMGGLLSVSGDLDTEDKEEHPLTVVVSDGKNTVEYAVTIKVVNANETPEFTSPLGDDAVKTIPENTNASEVIFTFTATDEDEDDLTFALRQGQSQDLFEIQNCRQQRGRRRRGLERRSPCESRRSWT